MPTLNVLWRLTPARSGAVESLRTPPRPGPRLVAPRSPVYVKIGDGGHARSAWSRCIGHSLPVTLEEETRPYVATLEQLAALGEPGTDTDAWNRAVEANQSSYLVLRQSREGRGAIGRLIDHPATTVRGWAAAHALLWNEERARPVLAALAEDEGLEGLSARQTLRAFDAGTLSHD